MSPVMQAAAAHVEAVGNLLARRVCMLRGVWNNLFVCCCTWTRISVYMQADTERRYITKLEREKASDANAREATRKLVSTLAQLEALNACLRAMGCVPVAAPPAPGGDDGTQGGWKPKNTLVKQVLRDMGRAPLAEVQPRNDARAL